MMPRQDIRSAFSVGAGSVFEVRVDLIDHSRRQTNLAVQRLLLGRIRAGDPRFEANAVIDLVEKRGIPALGATKWAAAIGRMDPRRDIALFLHSSSSAEGPGLYSILDRQ